MKKLLLFTMLLLATITMFTSCRQKPKHLSPIAKAQRLMERGGEFIESKQVAYDSAYSTLIEIYQIADTFYVFRDSIQRTTDDKMGCYSTPNTGTWEYTDTVTKRTVRYTTNDDGRALIAIPFTPHQNKYQVNAREADCCCDCNNRNECCVNYPNGSGCYCGACPQNNPCTGACISVWLDALGNQHSNTYFFKHDNATMDNVIIIDN